jgi:hypothetical protein
MPSRLLQRGHAILSRYRGAIVPLQAVTQRERIGELVVGNLPFRHLRLDLEVGIGRQQRIIDHVAVVALDVGGGDDRVEQPQVRMHDRGDGLAGSESRRRQRG